MSRKVVKFMPDEAIIKKGTKESRMYIIIEGHVRIVLRDGDDEINVATLKKNDFFGEMSLFTSKERTADAIALDNVTVTFVESIQQLNSFLLANPKFAAKMVHILVERLANTNELLIGKVSETNRLKAYNKVFGEK